MPKIHLPQLQKEIEVPVGAILMKELLAAGVPVASSCGGEAVCGKCKLMLSGPPSHCSSPGEPEILLMKKLRIDPKFRISCQVLVLGDMEVTATYW